MCHSLQMSQLANVLCAHWKLKPIRGPHCQGLLREVTWANAQKWWNGQPQVGKRARHNRALGAVELNDLLHRLVVTNVFGISAASSCFSHDLLLVHKGAVRRMRSGHYKCSVDCSWELKWFWAERVWSLIEGSLCRWNEPHSLTLVHDGTRCTGNAYVDWIDTDGRMRLAEYKCVPGK